MVNIDGGDKIIFMKSVLVIFMFIICLFIQPAFAEGEVQAEQPPQNPLYTAQNIPFENCTKMFEGVDKEKLFYLTLCAINANKFQTEEIQSHNGYIIYTAERQKYLATVAGIDNNNSILKITPCNNVYFFQPKIVVNIFKFIETNKMMEFK